MIRPLWTAALCLTLTATASAQEFYGDVGSQGYLGGGSVGSQEPLFPYDDQETWKHGYLQYVPFYGGYHSGRPYNYHHVFAQTQTSVGWGMPHGLPYSQQWWHRFDSMGDPGRAITEPNGYFGYAPSQAQSYQWAQMQAPGPSAVYAAPSSPIAPVQYQLPVIAPGVNPAVAPAQSAELRQYLAAPGAY
jgi:hypothetical protein